MSTKQILIESYLRLGTANGFDNVSLQNLADGAEIKKASIFSHFKSYEDLKRQALQYCLDDLENRTFEINPKVNDKEQLFIDLINSFTDKFTDFPVNALISMIVQKKSYDNEFSNLSEKIDFMIMSRFRVALDYCVQRSWSDLEDTDDMAVLFAGYLRKLIEKPDVSDSELSDFADMILNLI